MNYLVESNAIPAMPLPSVERLFPVTADNKYKASKWRAINESS